MNTSEIATRLATRLHIPDSTAKRLIRWTFNEILTGLLRDGEARIHGFGVFRIHTIAPRMSRNPYTNQPMKVGATHCVRFKAARALADVVRGAEKAIVSSNEEAQES